MDGPTVRLALKVGALGAVLAFACTPPDQPPELEVTATPKTDESEALRVSPVEALEAAVAHSKALESDVADVRFMLEAEEAERRGELKSASEQWFAALKIAQGKFGKRALDRWIKTYVAALGKKSDRAVLARLILAETQSGRVSPYMSQKGLTTDIALIPVVEATVPEWLTEDIAVAAPGVDPPRTHGIPTSDPLLLETSAANCKASKNRLQSWQAWIQSLSSDVRDYWNGLVLQCAGKPGEAITALKSVAPKLAKSRATHALAVEAMSRVASMQRAIGKRTEAADTYVDLMKLWDLFGVSAATMGLEEPAFSLRRVDETLWASRYRSLIGDYENAKLYAQASLNLIASTLTAKPNLSSTVREQFASLKAEAYHVLAYRVALEQHEFESATALNLLALQTPHLNREWRERLAWFAGVYEYLANHHEGAKRKWEALLAQTKDEAMRAMLYFWLGKTYDHLGRKAESRFYLSALADDYPLSFYTTVALDVAKIDGIKDWRSRFGNPSALVTRLEDGADFGLARLRHSGEIGRLLRRAEVLAAAGLAEYQTMAVDELDPQMSAELTLESHTGPFVYLTRLHYQAGSYLKAIGLTTRLAKAVPGFWQQWPEQLLIHFPRPYGDEYVRNAQETSLEKSLLLAISRQESGFDADIKSSANAIGVMQLIRPTAERFAKESGIEEANLDLLLINPSANIKLGSRYLKFLAHNYQGFEPAVYGGYNAGEYAVDLWLKRRAHSDPLMFVELVPFGETKDYIKNVWRNVAVYRFLETHMPEGMRNVRLHQRDGARN